MKKNMISVATILLIIIIFSKIILMTTNPNTKNNDSKHDITYNILNTNKEKSIYKEKGYYIYKTEDNKVLITIAAGMKNTGGFSIDIKDIVINNKKVKIYIKETEPRKDRIVNQVISYPIVQVEFSEKPESLIIKNIDNNSIYNKVN